MVIIANLIQVLLIAISISIVFSKDNTRVVVFLASFSLLSACLYFLNKAPDVALAEVAIGSAIMPLFYILSISKQREFIVMSHVDDDYLKNEKNQKGKGYLLLENFTDYYKLKLYIFNDAEKAELKGIFRKSNVDLIIEKDESTNTYFLIGKQSSILMNKLAQLVENDDKTIVVKVKESETRD